MVLSVSARFVRRWVWAFPGMVAGAWLVLFAVAQDPVQYTQLKQEVQALRVRSLQHGLAAVPGPAASDSVPESSLDRLPDAAQPARLWLALQQGLASQGMHVQMLRPQTPQETEPLSSQTLALRLHGRFLDWAQAWASLAESGPVWSLDKLTVTKGAAAADLVIDGVWRLWAHPQAGTAASWPASWDSGAQRAIQVSGPEPFGVVEKVHADVPAPSASEAVAVLPADPRAWPLAKVRFMGMWQQDGKRWAVLGAGTHWSVLEEGGRMVAEGYRVQSVNQDSVVLQRVSGRGPAHVLKLEEGAP